MFPWSVAIREERASGLCDLLAKRLGTLNNETMEAERSDENWVLLWSQKISQESNIDPAS